jgi:hypothetical protein
MKDFKAGKKITVDLGGGVTVTLRQAAVNPNSLTQAEREALYGVTKEVDLFGRELVSIEGPAVSLDSVLLDESQRNGLMNGLPVRLQQVAEQEITIHLFDSASQKLTSEQQARLAVGDSVTLEDGKVISNVRVKRPVVQVISAYYGTPLGMSVKKIVEGGVESYEYTIANPNDPANPVVVRLKAEGSGPGFQREYQGTMTRASTARYGFAVSVTGWSGSGLPPSLNGVTLTAAEWEARGQVTREVNGQTLTLTIRTLEGLTEQQKKDLKAGRFVKIGSEVLA